MSSFLHVERNIIMLHLFGMTVQLYACVCIYNNLLQSYCIFIRESVRFSFVHHQFIYKSDYEASRRARWLWYLIKRRFYVNSLLTLITKEAVEVSTRHRIKLKHLPCDRERQRERDCQRWKSLFALEFHHKFICMNMCAIGWINFKVHMFFKKPGVLW